METSSSSNEKALFVTMVLNAWNVYIDRVSKLLNTLTDEQLMSETAPGRNRGIYLIGHLIAVSDSVLPLLGLSERLYPHLDTFFLTSSDKSAYEIPDTGELKMYWHTINDTLTDHFKKIKPDEWFTRHNSVSPEDFAKEPYRNKLNVIINRTNHISYHLGQLIYLQKK